MKNINFLPSFLRQRALWFGVVICFLGTVMLLRWQERLVGMVERMKEEYQIDLELSRHKPEHLQTYRSVLEAAKLPQAKPYSSNEWIQIVQVAVAEEKLSLQELKPVHESKKSGSRRSGLFLVVEGNVPNLLNFLYRLAQADDLVYVKQLILSKTSEDSELIRAQMTLHQL